MYKLTLTLDGSKRTTNLTVESDKPFDRAIPMMQDITFTLPKGKRGKKVKRYTHK